MTGGQIESRKDVMDVARTVSNWDTLLGISISLGLWFICTIKC